MLPCPSVSPLLQSNPFSHLLYIRKPLLPHSSLLLLFLQSSIFSLPLSPSSLSLSPLSPSFSLPRSLRCVWTPELPAYIVRSPLSLLVSSHSTISSVCRCTHRLTCFNYTWRSRLIIIWSSSGSGNGFLLWKTDSFSSHKSVPLKVRRVIYPREKSKEDQKEDQFSGRTVFFPSTS